MRASTRLASIACACAGVIAFAGPASAPAAAGATRLGTAPALPSGARIVGTIATAVPMHVTITLKPRDPGALAKFATDVSTPGSPEYRDYLTPAQFAQRFGATPATLHAVAASLRAHGLVPGRAAPNALSIQVTATAAALEHAFSISFAHVALANGSSAIVNRQAPAVDRALAPDVQAILGLDTLSRAKPLLVRAHAAARAALRPHVVTGGPQPCPQASAAGVSEGGFTADQIAATYGLSGLYVSGGPGGGPDEGAGQTVAVLELEPHDPNDINTYQQCYGTTAPVSTVAVDGGAGSGSGSGEAALDIENVIGLAPRASVVVYEGPNAGSGPYDTFSAIISQHAAQVVTASWGQCEPLNGFGQASAENTLFEEAAAQGQSIFSASGDDGAEDCFPSSPTAQVDDPASQPFVTGVGGTSLGPSGETVWNGGVTIGASGGGVSSFWAMPSYQSANASALHVIGPASSGSTCSARSGFCREVPDVSADADPATGYVIYWSGGGPTQNPWQVVGGTSGAAPAWAALIALANASSACNGAPIGFADPGLYNAAASAYGSDFHDPTSGTNDMTGTNGGQFAAGPGYDMATGLGSPNGSALATGLCSDAVALANPGPQHSIAGDPVSLQVTAFDTRGAPVRFGAAGLPAGLSINPSSGKIGGRPRRVGTSTVTLSAIDSAGTAGHTSFTWTIQGNPKLSRVSLSQVAAARGTLSFTLAAGRGAPKIKTVSVAPPRGLRFTKSRSKVSVTGLGGRRVKFSVSLQHGQLVLKFRAPAKRVRVTIAYPRLRASGALVSQLAHHRASRVTLSLRVTDVLGLLTRLTTKVKPSG